MTARHLSTDYVLFEDKVLVSGGLDSNTKMKGISFPGKGGLRSGALCRIASFLSLVKMICKIPINTPRHKPLYSIAYKRESGVLGINNERLKSHVSWGNKQESCVLGFRVLFLNDIGDKLHTMARQ